MSLANFFDKAALGASSVLKNFDRESFSNSLTQRAVGIYFDDQAAQSMEGRIALEACINLLARLYPRLNICSSGGLANNFRLDLLQTAREINPEIHIDEKIDDSSVCIVAGDHCPDLQSPRIHIGSNGWIARLSTNGKVGFGNSSNPFGAAAAACLAAANVFRYIFAEQLEGGRLDESVTLSLIDLEPNNPKPTNPTLSEVDFQETHLIGVGAIGNGAAWVLRKVPRLAGILHLIDHEEIEISNLQRYMLPTQGHIGMPKVDVAADGWAKGLRIVAHKKRWAEYLGKRGDWNIQRVAVAVDSALDRCAVQSALPRYVINSWTRAGTVGISRHLFIGEQACLACLYYPDGKVKSEDELVAEAIGLPSAIREVRHLLYHNVPVSSNLLARIAEALNIDGASLASFEGRPLRSFYSVAVCGGILFRLSGSDKARDVEVPMAFQSAMAGIMLAAEVVVDSASARDFSIPTLTQIDLLKPLGKVLSTPRAKDPSERCICRDEEYIKAYRNKYSISPPQ